MNHNVCFFTVCGGGEDYEFLLGAIAHHALMGTHIVLDTTPNGRARTFKNLPPSVHWFHEPIYGAGWKNFKLRTATERAMRLAQEVGSDVIAYLDCDEFFSEQLAHWAFPLARDRMVEVKTVTWKSNHKPYDFGDSEWHRRLWPADMDVRILQNDAWIAHPEYNGNPEHHPIPSPPDHQKIIRAHGPIHHHLHYALGKKASLIETAETTIEGWREGGVELRHVEWPEDIEAWAKGGILPSARYS